MSSLIIPAFNEEKTVGDVVHAAVSFGLFDEVIVVSDGSTDGTVEAAQRAGATRVIVLEKNVGKGAAVAVGVAVTASSIICLLDADLLGLTADHAKSLLEPVLTERVKMQVGLVERGTLVNAVNMRLPLISGQRCFRRDVFENTLPDGRAGFGLELALNAACRRHGWTVGRSHLIGLGLRRKFDKVGIRKGLAEYASMSWRIMSVFSRSVFR